MSYIPLPYDKLSRQPETHFRWLKKTHLRGHSHVTSKRVSLDLPRDISENGSNERSVFNQIDRPFF